MLSKEDLKKYIGKKIKEYRLRSNLTQEQVGYFLGVGNNTVSAYERGAITPDSDGLFKLAKLFETSVDSLFPPAEYDKPYLNKVMDLDPDTLQAEQLQFLQRLMEKTLSLEGEEREKFLESIRFTVEYYNKLNS